MTTRYPFYWISLSAQVLAIVVSILWTAPSLADDGISASQISKISMIKTSAPELATSQSFLTTGLRGISGQGLTPSFCLNVDLASHHLSFDDQILLKGQETGNSLQATIYASAPEKHQGAQCYGSTLIVTTDFRALNSTAGELYTGGLNITISPE
jgi:hypothetical protein